MFKSLFSSLAVAGLMSLVPASASAEGPGPNAYVEVHIGTARPPARRHEVRTQAPGRGYVWIGGAWDWQGGQWVWLDGRWEQRAPHVYWVAPRYAAEYGHWRYVPGHWSNQTVQDGEDYRSWKDQRAHERAERHDHNHGH